MLRKVKGRHYDTSKSDFLGSRSSRDDPADLHYWSEGLYKTAYAAYFLAGTGGALSIYKGIPRCIPIDDDVAKQWLDQL